MPQSKRPCIIWGATGQAKVLYDILVTEGVEVLHVFDNNPCIVSPFAGIPFSIGVDGLISFIETLRDQHLRPSDIDCIAAIGGKNGESRESITLLMEARGFKGRSLIHESVIISSSAIIGKNVQLLAGSIIGPSSCIEDYVIINSGANVDHDCIVRKGSHLAPNATLAGEVIVGENVLIGSNATILPRICIANNAIVGAGAVVTKKVDTSAVVVGNPAEALIKN